MESVISFVYIDKNPEMKYISYKDITDKNSQEAFVEEVTGQEQVA
jgi:hypothetical protein